MTTSLKFELPINRQSVRPALKVTRDIRYKDYILAVRFDESDSPIQRENVPAGLLWSTSLRCPFVYLPDAQASNNLYLDPFQAPSGAQAVTLSVAPWASTSPEKGNPFSELVLETKVFDRPAVIIGKEV